MDRHRPEPSVAKRESGSRPGTRRWLVAERHSQQESGDVVARSIAIAPLDRAGGSPDRYPGRVLH